METVREELTTKNTEITERDQKKSWLSFFVCSVPSVGKYIVLVFTVCFLVPGIAFSSAWKWIGPARVYDMLREGSGLWLIDVRSNVDYETEHIEGSVNIPAMTLRYKKYPASKTLILVDDSLGQKNARETAEQLSQEGLEKVYVLDGGIVSWELDGYPVAKEKPVIRAVTKEELQWALAGKMPVKIFDMRDASEIKDGRIEGSLPVEGQDLRERLKNVREILKKEEGADLAKNLKKSRTAVLVFPETEDAKGLTEKILRDIKVDVRYLLGGYKTYAMEKVKGLHITGSCPSCPGK